MHPRPGGVPALQVYLVEADVDERSRKEIGDLRRLCTPIILHFHCHEIVGGQSQIKKEVWLPTALLSSIVYFCSTPSMNVIAQSKHPSLQFLTRGTADAPPVASQEICIMTILRKPSKSLYAPKKSKKTMKEPRTTDW